MPVNIPAALPAKQVLTSENIFVMSDERALHQDIRPLRIGIVNLMPTKIATETQLLRLLGNTPLQLQISLLRMETYDARNTAQEHLDAFYTTFAAARSSKFDGLIITGAPVERLAFEDVAYWPELCELMDWAKENVFSTLHVCWGAQAGLYHHYGVPKRELPSKVFGVFDHDVLVPTSRIVSGFDSPFPAPHSRHTDVLAEDIESVPQLQLLAVSPKAGVYLVASTDARQLFVTGHPEYDAETLGQEYRRDVDAGHHIDVPHNYFPDDDPRRPPRVTWRSHAHLLYANWLNYCVYQRTPFDPSNIPQEAITDDTWS
ncbi:MAG: homoserine O-succinyltransferase [Micrococcales bacterium]|nr:MAG: homoserine O-succinyltransferase [Micrococcales bacterium]PIE27759.1 MAG: homoserine O-succinyltransferase [Micrococcales bacterium]